MHIILNYGVLLVFSHVPCNDILTKSLQKGILLVKHGEKKSMLKQLSQTLCNKHISKQHGLHKHPDKRKDLIHMGHTLSLRFLKQSVCGSSAEVNDSTRGKWPHRTSVQNGSVIGAGVFRPLLKRPPERGRFLPVFSDRHNDVFIERSYRSQSSSAPS